jgi:hypothetical protein
MRKNFGFTMVFYEDAVSCSVYAKDVAAILGAAERAMCSAREQAMELAGFEFRYGGKAPGYSAIAHIAEKGAARSLCGQPAGPPLMGGCGECFRCNDAIVKRLGVWIYGV